jgi:Zn-dependent peptidase ImmA (M78 family)
MSEFVGASLRLARLFHGLSLADLGARVGVSKQFLSRVENGAEPTVSSPLEDTLASTLWVLPEFFRAADTNPISDEQCHFRRHLTTKVALRQVARARGEFLQKLVELIDEHVELPPYKVEEADPNSNDEIERAAENFRTKHGLGVGPLSNVLRVAENAGAVVIRAKDLASEIDAISFATQRPLVVLNDEARSSCRKRFGIAHELGHFALHIGVLTGDRVTESQANRFASALLMPRHAFARECRMGLRGSRLHWAGLSELKMRWKVSKAAIIYRAGQLGIFSDEQVRSGYIGLHRHGEALQEDEDVNIPHEMPETVDDSLRVMREMLGMPMVAIARMMRVQPRLLESLISRPAESPSTSATNVVRLFADGDQMTGEH